MTELHETDVDGVRCFWVDTPRPTLSASLLFRVGVVDEMFTQHGWTHLIEHLALEGRGGGALHVNGSVSPLVTSFDAHGPAEAVSHHFATVTRWLADPDLGRLGHHVKVLAAEGRTRGAGGVSEALVWRYGATGPGLTSFDEAGLGKAEPATLRAWAANVFTRSNCVLVLDGPPPAGLELPLPPGPGLRPIPRATPCTMPLPGTYLSSGLILSGTTQRSSAATLLPLLLERGLRVQLRDQQGASYAPWCHYEGIDAETAVVIAGTDISEEAVPGAAQTAADLVSRILRDGPNPQHLADCVAQVAQAMRDPYNAAAFAWRSGHQVLQGKNPDSFDEAVGQIEGVDPEAVRQHAEDLSNTLLVGAPQGATTPNGFTAVTRPRSDRSPGKAFRHVNWPADPSRLNVADDGVQMYDRNSVSTVRFTELVGLVVYPDGGRVLVAADSWNLVVDAREWHSGEDAVDLIDSRVPEDLHVPTLNAEPFTTPQRLGWARRWWRGFRRGVRTPAVGWVVAVLAVTGAVVTLARGVVLGTIVLSWFAYDVLKELRTGDSS